MRTLGIDYGDARVGIAVTDALGITAQGLETIHHNGNDKVILKRLDEIFAQYEVDTIVVGMPFNMDGTKTFRAEATEKFIHKLKCKYNKMKIETVDERLTTKEATTYMLEADLSRKKRKQKVDSLAANIILQTYLDKKGNNYE